MLHVVMLSLRIDYSWFTCYDKMVVEMGKWFYSSGSGEICKKGGGSSRDTFWNEHHLDAQSIAHHFFFLSLFLSNIRSLRLTSPSGLLVDLRGYNFDDYFPDVISASLVLSKKKSRKQRVFEKRSFGPRADRRKEFPKQDNRMLTNATLGLL